MLAKVIKLKISLARMLTIEVYEDFITNNESCHVT